MDMFEGMGELPLLDGEGVGSLAPGLGDLDDEDGEEEETRLIRASLRGKIEKLPPCMASRRPWEMLDMLAGVFDGVDLEPLSWGDNGGKGKRMRAGMIRRWPGLQRALMEANQEAQANAAAAQPQGMTGLSDSEKAVGKLEAQVRAADDPCVLPSYLSDILGRGNQAEENLDIVRCKGCSRVMLSSRFHRHASVCPRALEEKGHYYGDLFSGSGDKRKMGARGDVGLSDGGGLGRPEDSKGLEKKKRKKTTIASQLNKGVAPAQSIGGDLLHDMDQVCGVVFTSGVKLGERCTLPLLSCKLHSNDQKKKVIGRSMPYEQLLKKLVAERKAARAAGGGHRAQPVKNIVLRPAVLPKPMATWRSSFHPRKREIRNALGAIFMQNKALRKLKQ